MIKYSDALKYIYDYAISCLDEECDCVFNDEKEKFEKHQATLLEAINKAEKYDELDKLEIESKLIYKDHCDTIKRLEKENQELKIHSHFLESTIAGFTDMISGLQKENQILRDGVEAIAPTCRLDIETDGSKWIVHNEEDFNAEVFYTPIDDEQYNKIKEMLEVLNND